MTWTDVKVYGLNTLSLMITFSDVIDWVKLLIGLATLGYTIHKWYLMHKNNGTE